MLGEPRPGDARAASVRPRAYRRTRPPTGLDGVMVPLRPGEDGRAKASWREAACGNGLLPRRRGQAPEDPSISSPHAGERQAHAEGAACKRSRTHQASTPRDRDRRYRPMAPLLDNWTFLETLSPETEVSSTSGMLANICKPRPTMPWRPAGSRSTAISSVTIPVASPRMIRALRHLRDAAAGRTGPRPSGNSPSSASIAIACATTP